jgi:hypothetical protein
MKLASRIAAIAIALAIATPAVAQERTSGRFGVGVGVSDGALMDTLLFVPLNIAPNLRVEPFLGMNRFDVDEPPAAAPITDFFDPGQGKGSDFTLGAGLFFVQPVATQVQMYAGGRLGLQWESFKQQGPAADKWTRRNTILAGALGGEYLAHPRVALGAELMLAYVAFGDTEFTDGGTGAKFEGAGGSATQTQGTFFVRVYIF